MRLLIVGEGKRAESLAQALPAYGIAVERQAAPPIPGTSGGEVARIATAMRGFEELLDEGPDAVLLASCSNLALAALLVATKAGIPVASVENDAEAREGSRKLNRRLIRQLSDATLAADAAAVAAWLHAV